MEVAAENLAFREARPVPDLPDDLRLMQRLQLRLIANENDPAACLEGTESSLAVQRAASSTMTRSNGVLVRPKDGLPSPTQVPATICRVPARNGSKLRCAVCAPLRKSHAMIDD